MGGILVNVIGRCLYMNKKIVAVTACAAGIAHTYMAAEIFN